MTENEHADGKTIVRCIAVKNVCVPERQPNIVAECQDPKYRAHGARPVPMKHLGR